MNDNEKTYKNIKVGEYAAFNERRYSDPWAARVDEAGKVAEFVGKYTGGRRTGEAGDLYIINAVEGAFYAIGQRDYRGNGSERRYVKIVDGAPVDVSLADILAA